MLLGAEGSDAHAGNAQSGEKNVEDDEEEVLVAVGHGVDSPGARLIARSVMQDLDLDPASALGANHQRARGGPAFTSFAPAASFVLDRDFLQLAR